MVMSSEPCAVIRITSVSGASTLDALEQVDPVGVGQAQVNENEVEGAAREEGFRLARPCGAVFTS